MNPITKLLERLGRDPARKARRAPSEWEYYENLFVKDPTWSKKEPNSDETARWDAISGLLETHLASGPSPTILDVGCGRGWLTNRLSSCGEALGIEPVEPVVAHARRLFPDLRFEVGTPADVPGSDLFDLIVCSEVLEHVSDKPGFIGHLGRLLRKEGLLVVTTPRGELYEQWGREFGRPSQPVEEWISTADLQDLLEEKGFRVLESATAYVRDIYQVHACRKL